MELLSLKIMNIFETGEIKFIRKGTLILRQGEICNFGCRVINGCLKSYVIDDTGKEHIMQFAPEGWIITDMNSLFNNVPSDIIIEAIEDSEVYLIESEMLNIWGNASKEVLIEQIKIRAPIWKKEYYKNQKSEWLKGTSVKIR